ncbi:helix-turn-helix domain-containing protein [Catellatospora sp. TT07R-123]|uniref:AraC family transcriptional regulator n=1 Tax=Catellatospora sp. TT07R-123 TaxID=2733863 RepID=UPI001BB34250|nr:helix-turn-helix transcriptional regulator [Catellatospora sp. TT07R-123]
MSRHGQVGYEPGHVRPGFSADRIAGSAALAVASFGLSTGSGFPAHTHAEHQLTWAATGVLTVHADGRSWVLPSSLALWMPAGMPHAIVSATGGTMYGLYLPAATCPVDWAAPTVVAVDDLLRSLSVHLGRSDLTPQARARAEAVFYDVLRPVSVTTVAVPMPADDRALRVADALLADPADNRPLHAHARVAGASSRTLARLFRDETGLSFAEWRAQARLRAALALLAAGQPVTAVAGRVGFANASAFVAMFRQRTGTTPGAYFKAGQG